MSDKDFYTVLVWAVGLNAFFVFVLPRVIMPAIYRWMGVM